MKRAKATAESEPTTPAEESGGHRIVKFPWKPDSTSQWATFTMVRTTDGTLWSDLVVLHEDIRGARDEAWPSCSELQQWAKGNYPGLSARCVQQTVMEFHANICATTAARKLQAKNGEKVTAQYPCARPKYRSPTYSNQDGKIKGRTLRLSNGRGNKPFIIPLPKGLVLPGRLIETQLDMGEIRLVCELPPPAKVEADENAPPQDVHGGDPGVNSSMTVTNGDVAFVVSGRAGKAIIQARNKELAEIQSAMSGLTKGSRRWRRLNRRKGKMLAAHDRRATDYTHKVSAAVKEAIPGAKVFIGEGFNDAARGKRAKQAQMISQAPTGKIKFQIMYKLPGSEPIPEPDTSRTCPKCLCQKHKCSGRVFECDECGFKAHRDVVGATNILSLGLHGKMLKNQRVAVSITFIRPLKYPGRQKCPPGSSGGTPASSSAAKAQCESESTRSLAL